MIISENIVHKSWIESCHLSLRWDVSGNLIHKNSLPSDSKISFIIMLQYLGGDTWVQFNNKKRGEGDLVMPWSTRKHHGKINSFDLGIMHTHRLSTKQLKNRGPVICLIALYIILLVHWLKIAILMMRYINYTHMILYECLCIDL